MVIGISGNFKEGKNKLKEYLMENFNIIKYIDFDELLDTLLENFQISRKLNDNYLKNNSLLIDLKHKLDELLICELQKYNERDLIVIDYSLLEDSIGFELSDSVIKVNNSVKNISTNSFELFKHIRKSSIHDKVNKNKYAITMDFDENWKEKIKEYINYDFFGQTKVTVVVPIYNTSTYLPNCIESILSQTYRNLEVLLINDGSTDDSLQISELFALKDQRVRVINQKNVGLAETRNNGIKLATGEYICFIDSDDYIDNRMIETLLKTIQKTNADVCESSFYIHMKNGDIKDVSSEQKGIKYVEGHLHLINAYSDATILIPAWDKIYKLSAIKDILFDRSCFKEDADYIYRLCMAEKTFALVNIPFYHYIKRKTNSITSNKISPELFTLQEWGEKAYAEVLSYGEEYRDAAEKILYNSLVHILRNFMRDYKNNDLEENEFQNEIQNVVNEIIKLLFKSQNVEKFRKLSEVIDIINELLAKNVIYKEKMPSIEVPCIGILWNSLNDSMMQEAINIISNNATILEGVTIDLEDRYRDFIRDIYGKETEFAGIPIFKAGSLIDRYISNTIVILNLLIRVTNYMYLNKTKGFVYEEVAKLKNYIRKYFKPKITDYAYDNIFHLTVNQNEYDYTKDICQKYLNEDRGYKRVRK